MLGIGDHRAPAPDSPSLQAATQANGAPPIIQGGSMGRALCAPSIFQGPPRQNPWAHTPPPQPLHLDPHIHSKHSPRIRSASLLGAKPKIRSAPDFPFPRGLALEHEICYTRAPVPDSHYHQPATSAHRGTADHSGGEKGQGPPSPGRHSMVQCGKSLGPTLPPPAPSPWPATPLAYQPLARACRPPGH